MSTEEKQLSYYEQRMQLLGITPENNTIELWQFDAAKNENVLKPFPIFRQTEKGIDILVYRLNQYQVNYSKENSRWKNNQYCITRLEVPIEKPNRDTIKYLMPKGQPVLPFFAPQLCAAFATKQKIKTLYITEGYFKAFKACMHGIMCVGLSSITGMKEKETGELHKEIKELIIACQVERVVWLTDGDCRDITLKEITEDKDLYTRPYNFFRTVATFYDLLSKLSDLQLYFAHINSEQVPGHPKGLDDLLCQYVNPVDENAQPDLFTLEEIKTEFDAFDKIQDGRYNGKFLVKMNITYSIGKVHKYFMLANVDTFYLHHIERRPELKGQKFKFNGTLYLYDEDKAHCKIQVPREAKNYFRIGDHYYEHVSIPNKFGDLVRTYHRRDKKTIQDDCGKDIFQHIEKFKAQCIVPDHVNYQRVIKECFNVYHPFEHEPEDGDCTTSIEFVKHIFGTDEVSYTDINGQQVTLQRWEIGMDYIQLLYKNPQHILPILCLVSRENSTGKTTFLNWLKKIFGENVVVVGNADFQNDFNAHWTSRLVIGCDETKIDKHTVIEKIKAMSTANEVVINGKGMNQFSQEFFGKFILLSNNEDNFILVNDDDIRYWVIKVPVIRSKNLDLLKDLTDEIPAFLHFINTRKMATDRKERHWFDNRLLHTEALDKLRLNSRPSMMKFLRAQIEELFAATDKQVIYMPLKAIASELLKKPNEINYVKDLLNKMGYKVGNTMRGDYPRYAESRGQDGHIEIKYEPVKFHDRAYEFKRFDFLGDNVDIPENTTELPF